MNDYSTVQFVSMGAFFATIADPVIGGTYMTLLNTLSNFGGTYPQYFILKSVEYFTVATCHTQQGVKSGDCSTKQLKQTCESTQGTCVVEQDGYYFVNLMSVIVGFILLMVLIRPQVRLLERLPPSRWHVKK